MTTRRRGPAGLEEEVEDGKRSLTGAGGADRSLVNSEIRVRGGSLPNFLTWDFEDSLTRGLAGGLEEHVKDLNPSDHVEDEHAEGEDEGIRAIQRLNG